MISVRKIRLDLKKEQPQILDGQSKICNWLYNHVLEKANDLRVEYRRTLDEEISKTLYTQRGLRNLIPDIKIDHPFLYAVHSSPLKNAAIRLSGSIQDYQDCRHGRRAGKPTNWPKFRSWKKDWFSLLYDEPGKGFWVKKTKLKLTLGKDVDGKQIRLVLKLTEAFPNSFLPKIRNLRITKDGDSEYFAVFTLETADVEQLPACEQPVSENIISEKPPVAIAFDPNHKNLVYGVGTDGLAMEVLNFPNMKKLETRIDRLKTRRDKCKRKSTRIYRPDGTFVWKASRRWTFFNNLLDEAYRIRREQTKTYLFTLANQICKRYEVIGMGDYTPKGGGITTPMRRAMNNMSLIGRFKGVLSWVAKRSGRLYIEYKEEGTTRTCSECGYVVEGGIAPEIREWTCPQCGTFHIRDENSAKNGLMRVSPENDLLPRSGRRFGYEVSDRRVWWVTPSGVKSASRGLDVSAQPGTARNLNRGNANSTIRIKM
jgi:putative transposase